MRRLAVGLVLSSVRTETKESLRLGVGTQTGGEGASTNPSGASGMRVLHCGVKRLEGLAGVYTTRGDTGVGFVASRKCTIGGGEYPLGVFFGEGPRSHGDCRATVVATGATEATATEATEPVKPEALLQLIRRCGCPRSKLQLTRRCGSPNADDPHANGAVVLKSDAEDDECA